MDSTQNNQDKIIPDVDPPMPRHELLEIAIQRYRKRFDDLLRWINDVEKKAAALIAVNGVVLALSATLINNFSTIHQYISDDSIILLSSSSIFFILSAIIHTLQLLLSLNGVVLALSATLINNFSSILQYIADGTTILLSSGSIIFVVCTLIYTIQLSLFIGSMVSAYLGYKISTYTVPEISYLCEQSMKEDDRMSKTQVLERELAELKNSKTSLDAILNKKAYYIKLSQQFFILGCLTLVSLFILFLKVPYFGF